MSKVIATSVLVALLIGPAAFGQSLLGLISQTQNSDIGLTNNILLNHGHQTGNSDQHLVLNLCQDTERPCPTLASQSLIGAIGQIGNAWGECGVVELTQAVLGGTSQMQEVGECCDPKAQIQAVNLQAAQGIGKMDGPGGGDAHHTIVLGAAQNGSNAAGRVRERADVMALQNTYYQGDACAAGAVNSTMTVCTTQTQASI
jgi:hypothetical protein